MSAKIKFLIVPYASFITLGFYRGYQEQQFSYKQSLKKFDERLKEYPSLYNINDKPKYYSIDILGSTIFSGFVYSLPIFIPFVFVKELHRLEIYCRDYKDEYDKPSYYELF